MLYGCICWIMSISLTRTGVSQNTQTTAKILRFTLQCYTGVFYRLGFGWFVTKHTDTSKNAKAYIKKLYRCIRCILSISITLARDGVKLQTVVYDILPSGGRCRKAVFGVWDGVSQNTLTRQARTPRLTIIKVSLRYLGALMSV